MEFSAWVVFRVGVGSCFVNSKCRALSWIPKVVFLYDLSKAGPFAGPLYGPLFGSRSRSRSRSRDRRAGWACVVPYQGLGIEDGCLCWG